MSNKKEVATVTETGITTVLSKEELRKQMKSALSEIDKKLVKLQKGSTTGFKTGGTFKMNENDTNNINIINTVDVAYLIKALALMQRMEEEYEETAKKLQLTSYPPCPWCNYLVSAWIHDLKLRIGVVTNADAIRNLSNARAKLQTFLTEEDRLSITLNEIAALIK